MVSQNITETGHNFYQPISFLDNDMKKFGPACLHFDNMDESHIFLIRLHLLMVMIKARLMGYPTGEFRKKAVLENAAAVNKMIESTDLSVLGLQCSSHLFRQRVKLLCVMAVAIISDDYPLGVHRREAVLENIDTLMESAFATRKLALFHDVLNAA